MPPPPGAVPVVGSTVSLLASFLGREGSDGAQADGGSDGAEPHLEIDGGDDASGSYVPYRTELPPRPSSFEELGSGDDGDGAGETSLASAVAVGGEDESVAARAAPLLGDRFLRRQVRVATAAAAATAGALVATAVAAAGSVVAGGGPEGAEGAEGAAGACSGGAVAAGALSTAAVAEAVDAASTEKEERHALSPLALAVARGSQWRASGCAAEQPNGLQPPQPPQPSRRDDTGEAAGEAAGEDAPWHAASQGLQLTMRAASATTVCLCFESSPASGSPSRRLSPRTATAASEPPAPPTAATQPPIAALRSHKGRRRPVATATIDEWRPATRPAPTPPPRRPATPPAELQVDTSSGAYVDSLDEEAMDSLLAAGYLASTADADADADAA
eukprot:scaffold121053_cov66-Phaeocystis_antarctica.AAC.1